MKRPGVAMQVAPTRPNPRRWRNPCLTLIWNLLRADQWSRALVPPFRLPLSRHSRTEMPSEGWLRMSMPDAKPDQPQPPRDPPKEPVHEPPADTPGRPVEKPKRAQQP